MKITQLNLEGALILEPKVIRDYRGYFSETFNQDNFSNIGTAVCFIQENHSFSLEAGTLRGMHYQLGAKA